MRWLYHLVPRGAHLPDDYAPPSLARDGFVHLSFLDAVAESARLHFPAGVALDVWRVDPRRLDAPLALATTPRGPMPHLHGPLPRDAVRAVTPLEALETQPDAVTGHRVVFVAFEGMTLLDLVGVHDPVSRVRTMGFDADATTEIVGVTGRVWCSDGATLAVERVRPPLDDADLVVVPGGRDTRRLQRDEAVVAWLASRPANRAVASVCSGALLLGAAGRLRGRRATTHRSAFEELAAHGAEVVAERVVRDGAVWTAGGVTSGIDLGLALVEWLTDRATRDAVARQMEVAGEG